MGEMSLVRSFSRRRLGAWMQGPLDVTHDETVELCVVESGTMHVRLEDACGVHRGGEVAVIPAGVRHGCWTESEPIVEMIVHLDARLLAQTLPRAIEPGIWPLASADAIAALRDAAVASFEEAGRLAVEIMRDLGEHARKPIASDAPIVGVLEVVGQALERHWTVAQMARLAALSEAQFGRRFRAAAGQSPMRWLLDRRLTRAQWLMSTSDRTLTDIAMMVGFGSPSRFTEAFAKRHGQTPSVWRGMQ